MGMLIFLKEAMNPNIHIIFYLQLELVDREMKTHDEHTVAIIEKPKSRSRNAMISARMNLIKRSAVRVNKTIMTTDCTRRFGDIHSQSFTPTNRCMDLAK